MRTDKVAVGELRRELEACIVPSPHADTDPVLVRAPNLTAGEIAYILTCLPSFDWMRGFTPRKTVMGATRSEAADERLRATLAEIDNMRVRDTTAENRLRADAYAAAAAERGIPLSKCRCGQFHLGFTHGIELADGEYHSSQECTLAGKTLVP